MFIETELVEGGNDFNLLGCVDDQLGILGRLDHVVWVSVGGRLCSAGRVGLLLFYVLGVLQGLLVS